MKLLIILSIIACSCADKLDRTYLPPSSAATAGGSPGSLSAPGISPLSPASGVPGTSYGNPVTGTSGFTSPIGTPGFVGSSAGTPGFTGPSAGASGFGSPSSGTPGYARPTSGASAFGQSPFIKASAGGQQSSSSFGQVSGSNLPSGSGIGQPSAVGSQTPSSQYGQPAGISGFGKSGANSQSYAQSSIDSKQGAPSFAQSPQGQTYQSQRPQASYEKNAEILRYDNQNDGNTFSYSFETSNGISAEESGVAIDGVRAQGAFSYTDDDGQLIRVTYTADENGYQPQGDHLPTPPPIPEEILRSIEENARAAAAGTQEGAYNPDEDGSGVASPQLRRTQNYPSSGSPASQGAYTRPGQGSSPQYGAPSAQTASRNIPGSLSTQGFGKSAQSASGFDQSGQLSSQAGYQYTQPQAGSPLSRVSASSPSAGQYRPESALGAFQGASGQGFAPYGSGAASPVGSSGLGRTQGFGSAPASVSSAIGPDSGFGQNPQAPASQPSGQYQSSQAGSRPSMTGTSSYQYGRPGQKGSSEPGFGISSQDQGKPGQRFGSPRQPPTFTEEEGYKY